MKGVSVFKLGVGVMMVMALLVVSARSEDQQTQLIPENTESPSQDEDEATVEDEKPSQQTDVKRVFIPTKEWQTVEEGKMAHKN